MPACWAIAGVAMRIGSRKERTANISVRVLIELDSPAGSTLKNGWNRPLQSIAITTIIEVRIKEE
jgi:hypothetical protein